MTQQELNQLTVLQLRKLAKDHSVTLSSGIGKTGIIEKLLPVLSAIPDIARNTDDTDSYILSEPKYQAAWHNSDAPRYSAKPAYQASPSVSARPAWQSTTPSGQHMTMEQQHVQPLRQGGFTPRFGPAASIPAVS